MENTEHPRKHWSHSLAFIGMILSLLGCFITFLYVHTGDDSFTLLLPLDLATLVSGIIAFVFMPDKARVTKPYNQAVVCIALSLALPVIGPMFQIPHEHFSVNRCEHGIGDLGAAAISYASDHDDQLPSPDRWNEAIKPYIRTDMKFFDTAMDSFASPEAVRKLIFICPSMKETEKLPCYAMNAELKGLRLADVANPKNTVLLFESKPGKNLYGGPELLPRDSRHRYGDHRRFYYIERRMMDHYTVVFLDGRTKVVRQNDIDALGWKPKLKSQARSQEVN